MKKISKILSSVLAVSMLISCFAMNAFAASTTHTMALTATKTEDLVAGEQITVTITIDGTANLGAVGYRLKYDTSVFEIDTTMGEYYENYIDPDWYYENFENSRGSYKDFAKNYTLTKAEDTVNGYLTYSWYTSSSVATNYENFELGKFYFTVKDGATASGPVVFELVDDLAVTYTNDYGQNDSAAITADALSVALKAAAKKDVVIAIPAVKKSEEANGVYNAGFLADFTVDADTNNPVKDVKFTITSSDSTTEPAEKIVSLGSTTVKAGTVKVALNILNVPTGVELTTTVAPIAE